MKVFTHTTIHAKVISMAGLLTSLWAVAAILWLPATTTRLAAAILLTCLLPGLAMVEGGEALFKHRQPLFERLLLGATLSYTITIIAVLWLHYFFGYLPLYPLFGLLTTLGIGGFGVATVTNRPEPEGADTPQLFKFDGWLLALLLLSAYFSLYAISYSDYRGDEAEVVIRAVATLKGEEQPILSHTKGPAEITLTAAVGLFYGAFSELSTRLPFALANWLGVIWAYLLGQCLFGKRVGLLALLLLAINGWLVSHSHTAQYQTTILMAGTASVWAYYRFYQSGRHGFHLYGALFMATAILAHYDGSSTGPAIIYLLVIIAFTEKKAGTRQLRTRLLPAAGTLLLAAAIVLSFYVPFLLNPARSDIEGHFWRNFGAEQPYNNWDTFYVNALYYNSSYYVVGIGLLLVLGTLRGFYLVTGGGNRGMAAVSLALPLLLLSWTNLLPPWYAVLVYLGMMVLFIAATRVTPSIKMLLLWNLFPMGLYLFLVIRPGNHYYVIMPPLMLLVARTLNWLVQQLKRLPLTARRWAMGAAGLILVLWIGLSAWYQQLVFLQTNLEYMLTYPRHRNEIFLNDPRYPFDIRIGWGFPYRLGWQTISDLYRRNYLAGDWYSNDINNSIEWYTLGSPRNPCYPRYFMLTNIGYKNPPLQVPLEDIDRFYQLNAVVNVNGHERLQLFEFKPAIDTLPPAVFQEPASFDTTYSPDLFHGKASTDSITAGEVELPIPVNFMPHPDTLKAVAEAYKDSRITQVKDRAELQSYNLHTTWTQPGDVLLIDLTWQASDIINLPYKTFIHMEDEAGQRAAQSDHIPNCGAAPTNSWEIGKPVKDRHLLALPDNLPPGMYTLRVGLYEPRTGLPMDVIDHLGNPQGISFTLPPLTLPQTGQ